MNEFRETNKKGDWHWIEKTCGVILPRVPFRKMVLFLSEFFECWMFGEKPFGSLVKYKSNSNKSHPKARPETTQKAPKVNLGVPRSKEAAKVGSRRCSSCFGVPLYTQKALKYCACRQNRASRNSEGHRGTQSTQRDTEGHRAHRRVSDT